MGTVYVMVMIAVQAHLRFPNSSVTWAIRRSAESVLETMAEKPAACASCSITRPE